MARFWQRRDYVVIRTYTELGTEVTALLLVAICGICGFPAVAWRSAIEFLSNP
jgi:hypothetical protein